MFKKTKRIVSAILVVALAGTTLMLSGCGDKATNEKVSISIGDWPSETDSTYAVYEGYKSSMEELHGIEVLPDSSTGNTTSYITRAISGQLPNLYVISYTEANNVINSQFCADITEASKEYKYIESLNPLVLDKVSRDGKVYGIPQTAYALGLACNKELFIEAGLVNEDGTLKYPQTYEELAQAAVTIKEKTGKAGIMFPTKDNQGGWIFTNVAWSYGVEFMKQDKNGKWIATFDTKECVEALQFIKDLKWKYNVLPENALLNITDEQQLFATNQAAMYIIHPPERMLVKKYEMSKDNICFARVPAGPKGRYALMGGNYYAISPESTPEQIDAIFKFLEIKGHSPKVTEEIKQANAASMENDNKENVPVMREPALRLWINDERITMDTELRDIYANVPVENFADYSSFDGVTIHEEDPVCTQELYSILDGGIQKVLTDENADVAAIVKQMASDFQKNHLDKID